MTTVADGTPGTVVRQHVGALDPSFATRAGPASVILDGLLKTKYGEEIPAIVGIGRGEPYLRVWLADTAPPGIYSARAKVDDEIFPIEILVDPMPRVRIFPNCLTFSGAPGDKVSATFDLENLGNVAIDLADKAVVGAFASDGLATAFSSVYEIETDDLQQLIESFVRRLRDGYGGLVRMTFDGTKAPLVPGERRTIAVCATLPLKMKKGRPYHFVLKFAGLNTAVRMLAV